jgi:hypothetical protein
MRRWIAVGLWIFAGLTIIDTGISLALTCHEPSYQPGSGQDSATDCSVFQAPIFRFLFWFANAFDNHGEAVIALFTIVLAISTIGLWRSTRKLWEAGEKQIAVAAFAANSSEQSARAAHRAAAIMDQTAERQLRAYVVVTHAKVTNFEGMPEFYLEYQNAGQTPAYDLVARVAVHLADWPLTEIPPLDMEGIASSVILGPSLHGHTTINPDRALPEPDLAAIRSGGKAVYFHGLITYRDSFGTNRETRFRYQICGQQFSIGSKGDITVSPEGNTAT